MLNLKPFSVKSLQTIIHLKSSTPYVSALKRIQKHIIQLPKKQPSVKYVTVKGMGVKPVEKLMQLAVFFQVEEGFKVDMFTSSVEVLDEYVEEDEESGSSVFKKRLVSSVVMRIWRKDVK
ncbi:hypothetical protein BABINDRAFT_12943 [Babjeviella inositovora NRRL Y-12698]|uniref:Uncharacterized protein n=1 Tax=Babjeviella inositovora NRRL Y-12698 TaxID=984486 RepID=A0A1E3QT21_9ASCO|nr:uncharacterized protein BABINDRAFT_12943 [Babjeviella inositovora NRRL Y-12698]ODQ80839.1 hypothetical protein BABINDRAFT_12943 [Babjeviella inositovora NRRL Y-12698]